MERECVRLNFDVSRFWVGNEYASSRPGWKELASGESGVPYRVAETQFDAPPDAGVATFQWLNVPLITLSTSTSRMRAQLVRK